MKKEDAEDVKNPEDPSAPAVPVKTRKEKKKKEKKNRQTDGIQLPVLVEFTYTISVMLLVFVGLAVIIISFFTGASLLHLVLRTSAAMLAMGCLLMVIFQQVSSGVLQASLVEQEEVQTTKTEKAEPAEGSVIPENHEMAEA